MSITNSTFKNNIGSAFVSVLLLAIILNVVFMAIYMTVSRTQKMTEKKRITTSALTLAEAGKEKLYGEIAHKIFTPKAKTRLNVYSNFPFSNGNFSVNCSSNTGLDTIWVESIGQDKQTITKIFVVAAIQAVKNSSTLQIDGAITARGNVSLLGNINIDGRDHDTNSTVTGSGILGISTCMTASIGGSASVGGVGIAPGKKGADPATYKEFQPVSSKFDSPEAFLGLPEGALDEFKTTSISTPFNGIVYYTGTEVQTLHFGNSSGILILHNTAQNAILKANGGQFKGLIITDASDKCNGIVQILGGVVTLSSYTNAAFGNGNSEILYSSYVLNNLEKYYPVEKYEVKEVSWKQV